MIFFINYIIKFFLLILSILFLFLFKCIYSKICEKIKIEINNSFEISEYENNKNYFNHSKTVKSIAFFFPEFIYDSKYNYYNYHIFIKYYKTNKVIMKKNEVLSKLIKKQVDLAKNHGIYGFAIYFNLNYWKKTNFILEKLVNKDINFPFFLIWNNRELGNLLNNSKNYLLNKKRFYCKSIEIFFKKIKKYLILEIYININDKPVISINEPSEIPNLIEVLLALRKEAKNSHIGDIFIFFPFRKIDIDKKYINLFDGSYDFSEIDTLQNKLELKNTYYSSFIINN